MKKEISKTKKIAIDDHLGCFGEFNIDDPVCKKFCALNLKCAIENDQNTRMEILEELTVQEMMYQNPQ